MEKSKKFENVNPEFTRVMREIVKPEKTVEVTLIVFKMDEGDKFHGYSPELRFFGKHENIAEAKEYMEGYLLRLLCHRLRYKNLENLGWKVSETEAIPPIFTDEQAVEKAREVYGEIVEPKIIKIHAKLPKTRNLW